MHFINVLAGQVARPAHLSARTRDLSEYFSSKPNYVYLQAFRDGVVAPRLIDRGFTLWLAHHIHPCLKIALWGGLPPPKKSLKLSPEPGGTPPACILAGE